jgi:hypothetical protein
VPTANGLTTETTRHKRRKVNIAMELSINDTAPDFEADTTVPQPQ